MDVGINVKSIVDIVKGVYFRDIEQQRQNNNVKTTTSKQHSLANDNSCWIVGVIRAGVVLSVQNGLGNVHISSAGHGVVAPSHRLFHERDSSRSAAAHAGGNGLSAHQPASNINDTTNQCWRWCAPGDRAKRESFVVRDTLRTLLRYRWWVRGSHPLLDALVSGQDPLRLFSRAVFRVHVLFAQPPQVDSVQHRGWGSGEIASRPEQRISHISDDMSHPTE